MDDVVKLCEERMAEAHRVIDDAMLRLMYPECFPPVENGKTYLELLADLVPVMPDRTVK